MNSDGELLVTTGNTESSDATCHLVDPYGAMSNASHTWRFGQPAVFDTTSNGPYTDSVEIEATNALMVQNMALSISAIQGGSSGVATSVNLGSTSASGSVSLSGISPGDFTIYVIATSPGMLDWHAELDIYGCCEKKNTPPVIMVNMDQIEGTYATWSSDGYSFSLSGTAIDPDGGAVSLSATMCEETTNSFTQNGDSWIVSLSIAKCVSQGQTTQYDVELSVTDSVGAISTESISIVISKKSVTNKVEIIIISRWIVTHYVATHFHSSVEYLYRLSLFTLQMNCIDIQFSSIIHRIVSTKFYIISDCIY